MVYPDRVLDVEVRCYNIGLTQTLMAPEVPSISSEVSDPPAPRLGLTELRLSACAYSYIL
jgi:hypothetical protein